MNTKFLRKGIEKGKISPYLKDALKEIITAFKQNDIELATELTAVKSLIGGSVKHSFGEDCKYNRTVLGEDFYHYLDGLHHKLAFSRGEMPAGMTTVTINGLYSRPLSERKSQTLARMKEEYRKIKEKIK